MATKLRRVTLSLPPELDQALARYGDITHASQAKFIVECLESSIPVIHGMCDAVEAAKNGDVSVAKDLISEQVSTVESRFNSIESDLDNIKAD